MEWSVTAWSWTAWALTVAAVGVSGLVAWAEGHWRRRPGLELGFVNHGGMWGDGLLLPVANAVAAPLIPMDGRVIGALLLAATASVLLHVHWHGGTRHGFRDHLWPSRPAAHWARDLSWAGWCHVAFVTGQLAWLMAFAVTAAPLAVVLIVTAVLTIHVPLGLLQPAWLATGHVPRSNVRLLVAGVAAAWLVAVFKAQAPGAAF